VELTLRYRGPLAAAGANSRVREKHEIRAELSRQLSAYWEQSKRLKELFAQAQTQSQSLQIAELQKDQFVVPRPLKDVTKFWWRWPLSGYNFVPLVTQVQEVHVELKIRLYRKNQGILFQGGDLDNRLKTFFDALQVPKDSSQVPTGPESSQPSEHWPTVFCLMDNDNLVTKLTIESFKLLTEIPAEYKSVQNYVELDLDVIIHPITPMMGTINMLFKG
jgi:hypothetical protein